MNSETISSGKMGNFSGKGGKHTEKDKEHHDVEGKPPNNDSETLYNELTADMPTTAGSK